MTSAIILTNSNQATFEPWPIDVYSDFPWDTEYPSGAGALDLVNTYQVNVPSFMIGKPIEVWAHGGHDAYAANANSYYTVLQRWNGAQLVNVAYQFWVNNGAACYSFRSGPFICSSGEYFKMVGQKWGGPVVYLNGNCTSVALATLDRVGFGKVVNPVDLTINSGEFTQLPFDLTTWPDISMDTLNAWDDTNKMWVAPSNASFAAFTGAPTVTAFTNGTSYKVMLAEHPDPSDKATYNQIGIWLANSLDSRGGLPQNFGLHKVTPGYGYSLWVYALTGSADERTYEGSNQGTFSVEWLP